MPRFLNDEILGELEGRWRDLAPGMSERMQPGLDDAEIDRIGRPLGLTIPEEARRLFRWHGGSGLSDVTWSRGLLSLQRCVTSTLEFREDDDDWRPGWLNFMNERPYIALDCAVGHDDPVPVWHYDYALAPPTRPVFESIGDLLTFWIELLDGGHVYWTSPGWRAREPLPEDIAAKIGGVPSD